MTVGRSKTALRRYALTFPGAWEDHPWGEDVTKVGKKIFVFFGRPPNIVLSVGVKLPSSLLYARTLPFSGPMGYGMDRSGWIVAHFKTKDDVPLDLLKEWIAESYAAVAPKRAALAPKRATAGRAPKRDAKPGDRRPTPRAKRAAPRS